MDGLPTERRTFVKGVGSGMLGSLLPATVVDAAESDTVTILGDFEGSLDNWRTNGGNTLKQQSSDEWNRPVTNGEGVLKVHASGDPYPMVYNRKRVRAADLIETPYLLADVTVGQFENDSTDLAFNFRYHRLAGEDANHGSNSTSGKGGSGGGNNGGVGASGSSNGGSANDKPGQSQSPLVAASETMVVPQYVKTTLTWDLSDLAKMKRDESDRIDLAWHAAGEEPKTGPSGRGPGTPLNGSVYLDNIRLVDSITELSERAMARKLTRLKARHGTLEYRNERSDVESLTERGRFVFNDGTEVGVEFSAETVNKWHYSIGEETYRLGGGWE